MNRLEIETKVKEVVALQFGVKLEELESGTNFVTDLHADSLDAVEVVMCIEDRFDLSIPDEESDKMVNVQMVSDYVEKKLAERDKSS